jgi:serine/threonine protein kinase
LIAAVQYLHLNGIVHHDIRPANILIKPDETINVCDFGILKSTRAGSTALSTRKGTVQYSPPEFFDNDLPLTDKSDAWSIGVTPYEMSTGDLLFADSNLRKLLNNICESEPTFPNNSFSSLLRQLFRKEPSNRPSISSLPSLSVKDHSTKIDGSTIKLLRQRAQKGDAASTFAFGQKYESVSGIIRNLHERVSVLQFFFQNNS